MARPKKPVHIAVIASNVHTSQGRLERGWQGELPAAEVETIEEIDAANGTTRIIRIQATAPQVEDEDG